MPKIKHYLVIKANIGTVYTALTRNDAFPGWYTNANSENQKIGSVISFSFGDKYEDQMKIIDLQKNKKVVWECVKGDPEWLGTHLIFELEEKNNNSTILKFTHAKWQKVTDFWANCNYHWGYYLRSLKLFCETGKGMPFGTNEYQ